MNLDLLEFNSARFGAELDRIQVSGAVPAVEKRKPVAKPRPSQKTERLTEQFSLPWSEFEAMTEDEVFTYIDIMVNRIGIHAKNKLGRMGGPGGRFYRFDVPESSVNRKVIAYDKDGVFIVTTICRKVFRGHPDNPEMGVEVADFEFQAEIGKI